MSDRVVSKSVHLRGPSFAEGGADNVLDDVTRWAYTEDVEEMCHFHIECDVHEDHPDGYCRECLRELTRKRYQAGSKGCVLDI